MKLLFENWRKFKALNEIGVSDMRTFDPDPPPRKRQPKDEFSELRYGLIKSYRDGENKKAFIGPKGVLRRRLFDNNVPQEIVEEYYDTQILPQVIRVISTTPIRKEWGEILANRAGHYEPQTGEIAQDPITTAVFPEMIFDHEMTHAIDYGVNLVRPWREKEEGKWWWYKEDADWEEEDEDSYTDEGDPNTIGNEDYGEWEPTINTDHKLHKYLKRGLHPGFDPRLDWEDPRSRTKKEGFTEPAKEKRLRDWNIDVMRKIFPKLPQYQYHNWADKQGLDWRDEQNRTNYYSDPIRALSRGFTGGPPHHGRAGENYDSITTQRKKQQREYTPDDVKRMRSPFSRYIYSHLPGVSMDLEKAIYDYGDPEATAEEMSDWLNQVSKAEKPSLEQEPYQDTTKMKA